jgi:tetratricopeptide (TPR) repeat protein
VRCIAGYNRARSPGRSMQPRSNVIPVLAWLGASFAFALFFLVGDEPCRGAQTAPEAGPGSAQDAGQLAKTAESYERFLRAPVPPQSRRFEVEAHLGAVYFLLHRYRDSLAVLKPVLARQHSSPGSAEIPTAGPLLAQSWLVSGLDYLQLNQLPDSIAALRRALAVQSTNASARMALGDALARSGRMEDAAREYEKQARLTPSLPDAWYKLGLAHSQLSLEISRQEVKAAERNLTGQLNAEELLAKGDNLNAARILFRLVHRAPNQPEVHAELGTALLTLGYANAAEGHFQQELRENPESPLAELGAAQTSALRSDWEQVRARLERVSRSQPRELLRLLELPPAGLVVQAWGAGQMTPPPSFAESSAGTIWKSWLSDSNLVPRVAADGKTGSAHGCTGTEWKNPLPGIWLTEPCYGELVARLAAGRALSESARVKVAEAEFRLGQYDAALRSAKLLRAADRRSGWGVYWLSKAHDAIAERCFLTVGALNPDSARVHQMLAEHYAKLSDYPKAKTEFQNAIRLAPSSPDLHLGLGTVLARTSDWVQAEKELKTTLDLAPESAFARYQLGHVYVQENLWQEAIEQLRQVPGDSTVLLSARLDLAKAEAETGRTAQAVEDLLSVAALDHDGELYFRLASLYRSLGDQSRAHQALATFQQLRAASLQTDTEELGALEKEQGPAEAGNPRAP